MSHCKLSGEYFVFIVKQVFRRQLTLFQFSQFVCNVTKTFANIIVSCELKRSALQKNLFNMVAFSKSENYKTRAMAQLVKRTSCVVRKGLGLRPFYQILFTLTNLSCIVFIRPRLPLSLFILLTGYRPTKTEK